MSEAAQTRIKDALWAIVFAGMVASIIRFASGLGTATGMNDSAPWGLWIAFKLVFVALAGGGFTLAAMVYIFKLESYRPILRRAILIALLGYGSFIVSLLFDLGLPWHIYMPIIHWQHHSVMFEIAWCVLLYFSVLVLEFSPAILEHPLFNRPIFKFILHWLHRLTIPTVIAGIVLSTLHQSSLGSLFLIMPHRVHPLWYSPWIPYMFFTSAIAAGFMALVLEGYLVEWWFKKPMHTDLLNRLAEGAILPLGLYLVLRVTDQILRGVLPGAIDGSWQSLLYLAEIILGGVIPIILLSIEKMRHSREGLLTSAVLVILGIMSQRMSLSMFTMLRAAGTSYSPTLSEIIITFTIPAAAILIYLFFAENLKIFETQAIPPENQPQRLLPVQRRKFGQPVSGLRAVFARRSSLGVFIIALALSIFAFTNKTPANPVQAAAGWETLLIDGNQKSYAVSFPHVEHQERLAILVGEKENCQTCHHMDIPGDEATACAQCHTDQHQPSLIFNHNTHQQALGGNQSCSNCHTQEHARLTEAICQDCHSARISAQEPEITSMTAPSYFDAMHGRCLACHQQKAVELENPDMALCSTCHGVQPEEMSQISARDPGK